MKPAVTGSVMAWGYPWSKGGPIINYVLSETPSTLTIILGRRGQRRNKSGACGGVL